MIWGGSGNEMSEQLLKPNMRSNGRLAPVQTRILRAGQPLWTHWHVA
jgi:hypothetical protein